MSSRLFCLAARLSSSIDKHSCVRCAPLEITRRLFSASSGLEKNWRQLTPQQRKGWTILGWSKYTWQGKAEAPFTDTCMWHEMTVREQEAAGDMLGYDEASWDQEMLGDDE